MRFLSTSFLTSTQILVLALGTGLSVLSAQDLPTPTHVWTGASITNDFWDNADNWVGSAPASSGSSTTVLGFGAADKYTSELGNSQFLVRNLIFLADAGAYTLSGESINVHGTENPTNTQSIIYNRSQYLQTIQNTLYFSVNNTVFDTGAAGILWSGDVESTAGAGTYTVIKRGDGDLIVTGDHTGADKNIAWDLQRGTLVMDASSPGFASNSNVTLSGGNLKVVGSDSGTTTVNLGTFGGLGAKRAMKLIVDSNGGAGTAVTFDNWATTHTLSPGRVYAHRSASSLNIDLSSGNSTFSLGTIVHNTGTEETPVWSNSPVVNGIMSFVTVTDTVKTGFATISGGDERGNGGTVVRYTGHTPMPASGGSATNYSLSGNHTVTGGSFYTITIQGSGTLSGSAPATRLSLTTNSAILMEEGVGDYYINVAGMGNGTFFRMYNYSTDGDLIINSRIDGGANYANHTLTTGGPGTIVLNAIGGSTLVGDAGSGGLNVIEGRLVSNGDQLSVTAAVDVYDGILAGIGSIGGGLVFDWLADPKWIPGSTRYTPVTIHNGGTIDASNVGDKTLTIVGSLNLNSEGSAYHMMLAETRGDPLSVTVAAPVDTAVTLNGNLSLILDYAPTLNEWMVLLTTNGVISGEFLTINGQSFYGLNGDEFSLLYNSQDYGFRIAYDHDLGGGITAVAIQVQAIPEPATVAALVGIGLAGMIVLRRRSKTIV